MSFKPVKPKVETRETSRAGVAVKNRVNWVFKDTIVLSCIGLAFFLFIVLYSYDPIDPGFDSAGGVHDINNYGGKTGAWLSSMLLYVFGIFGFIIPFGIFIAGWITLKLRTGSETDYLRFGISLIGLLLLISAGSGLANLYMSPHGGIIELPYSSGGVWGYELSRWLVKGIDLLGATLFLLVLFALSVSMLSSRTWLSIIEVTGRLAWKLGAATKKRIVNSPALNNLADQVRLKIAGGSAVNESAGLVIAKQHSVSTSGSAVQGGTQTSQKPLAKLLNAFKNTVSPARSNQAESGAQKNEPAISFDGSNSNHSRTAQTTQTATHNAQESPSASATYSSITATSTIDSTVIENEQASSVSENVVPNISNYFKMHIYIVATTIILPRRQRHPTPVLFPGKSHGWRSLVGCSLWGR